MFFQFFAMSLGNLHDRLLLNGHSLVVVLRFSDVDVKVGRLGVALAVMGMPAAAASVAGTPEPQESVRPACFRSSRLRM